MTHLVEVKEPRETPDCLRRGVMALWRGVFALPYNEGMEVMLLARPKETAMDCMYSILSHSEA
jgi:hypothetical protein